jgi:lipoate-protein ligase A
MAVDEVLMDSARAGQTTLRLYGWEPGCLSFGRNQTARGRYDGARAAERGIDVVRRPTGGRSVFHHRELTYSVTGPVETWGGLRSAYLRINRALAAGLRALGVPARVVDERGNGPIPRPTVRACFRDPLPGEVIVGGRKLIGSAQWRDGGALLQHGSVLLHNDQSTVEDLRIGGRRSAGRRARRIPGSPAGHRHDCCRPLRLVRRRPRLRGDPGGACGGGARGGRPAAREVRGRCLDMATVTTQEDR